MNNTRSIFFLPMVAILSSCSYTFYDAVCDYPVAGAVSKVAVLPETLVETSGLAWQDSLFLSFNDSGGEAELLGFSPDGRIPFPNNYLIFSIDFNGE